MSEQNRYRTTFNYKSRETEEWTGWIEYGARVRADTWQDAIQEWLDSGWAAADYTVVAETPSEDGRSGIIEIQFDTPQYFRAGAKIGVQFKATLIED